MVILNGDVREEHTDMKLIDCRTEGDKTWFILADKTDAEKKEEAIKALLEKNAGDIADLYMALAELYEAGMLNA